MAKLTSPKIFVRFQELGISAISRGTKGTVAIIVRDAVALDPFVLTQATQTPTKLGVANQNYIKRAFLGYVDPPKKVIVYTIPAAGATALAEEDVEVENAESAETEGTEAEGTETEGAETGVISALAAALTYFSSQDFDYLVGPADCTPEEAAEIASWIKTQRTMKAVKHKAVLPKYKADYCGVVNFTTEKLYAGEVVYTTAEYCSRIAGLLAGTPMKIAGTYAPLTDLTDVSRLTTEEENEAVGNGELIAIWDGRKAKLNRAVTSLVTTTEGMLDSFKKIKIVEIMDLIRTDIHITAEDEYIGKFANTYDNKLLLVTAIRGYFAGLERDGLVQPGYTVEIDVDAQEQWLQSQGTDTSEMSVQEIKEANTGTHVFLKVRCKILDAIEDIDIVVEI